MSNFELSDWRQEVANRDTVLGYEAWRSKELEAARWEQLEAQKSSFDCLGRAGDRAEAEKILKEQLEFPFASVRQSPKFAASRHYPLPASDVPPFHYFNVEGEEVAIYHEAFAVLQIFLTPRVWSPEFLATLTEVTKTI